MAWTKENRNESVKQHRATLRGCTRVLLLVAFGASATLALHACTTRDNAGPPPDATVPVASPPQGSTPSALPDDPAFVPVTVQQPASRWVGVRWSELPGFETDAITQALPALTRNCDTPNVRPPQGWNVVCQELNAWRTTNSSSNSTHSIKPDDNALRAWLRLRFDAYRVEAKDGNPDGLATGYFEPSFEAARVATGSKRYALHRAPNALNARASWFTREQMETLPEAREALRGKAIAYVSDPLDVLMVQIQGSGRLRVTESDGREQTIRIAFAGHNNQPYKSVGRWLIEQGELKPDNAAWPGIRDWARRNPQRVQEMLWANPRVVFFKEEPLPDPSVGPRGAQGVPLTPERSIAVDPKSIPYGTPAWLDTTEPLSNTPLRRMVVAQDTGSAIVGAVRADYFWGPGERAEQQASRMKQKLRMWVLWPKGERPVPAR